MSKLEYNFKSKLEHHMKFPFKFRAIILSLWICNIIWAITITIDIPIDTIPKSQLPMIIGAMLWKNILMAIPLTLVSFGRFIKEDCDVSLYIDNEKIQVLYKSLNKFNYGSYPDNVDICISYYIKDIVKIEKHNEGIIIVGKSKEDVYDLDKKCLSSKKYFTSEDMVYIPQKQSCEIYEKINDLLNL